MVEETDEEYMRQTMTEGSERRKLQQSFSEKGIVPMQVEGELADVRLA